MKGVLPQVTGYVLAGGRSSRMGQDKAFLQIDGIALVERALHRLGQVCAQVRILSGPANRERDALLSYYAPLVPDVEAGYAGPLAGVAAALADCTSACALILPVDQPGLPARFLSPLVEAITNHAAAAACLQSGDRVEPLPLAVSPALLPALLHALHAGHRRLLPTVQTAAAHIGRPLRLCALDPGLESASCLYNLNTPHELADWLRTSHTSNQSARPASEEVYGFRSEGAQGGRGQERRRGLRSGPN